jgi:hypothetical protein
MMNVLRDHPAYKAMLVDFDILIFSQTPPEPDIACAGPIPFWLSRRNRIADAKLSYYNAPDWWILK